MALDWLGDPNLAFPSVAIVIMWSYMGSEIYAHYRAADKIDY